MEPVEVKKRGRGRPRKRRREEEEVIEKQKAEIAVKKQELENSWKPLVGRYVLKEFDDNGVFLGKIVSYDAGLYRVDYEGGDCEDLESGDLRHLVLGEDYFDDDLNERRVKLDQLVVEKSFRKKGEIDKKKEVGNSVKTGTLTAVENDDDEADSSSDSCEFVQYEDLELEIEVPIPPPPELPQSSGNVGVPEKFVSHLFSVYGFLRSFSIRLFLSPFTLDELVGAINCQVQNTLMDSIHVVLLCTLRDRLETLSSDGSELAAKCLRCLDWSLLDLLTWPVYLLHYFITMGYAKRPELKEFCDEVLKREYYSLPSSKKLTILQILCDDVLDCAEVRTEIDAREESEFGIDPDAVATDVPDNGPRRVHPRYSKTSACKDREVLEIIAENKGTNSSSSTKCLGRDGDASNVGVDGNSDECRLCGMDGILLCCDGCPSAYHSRCIGVVKMHIPEGAWYCPECTIKKQGPTVNVGTSLKGAEIFGVDIYDQVFLGTCNHLLVLRASASSEPCLRYYSQKDIPKVLQAVSASEQLRSLYLHISKAIVDYWKIPQIIFSFPDTSERILPAGFIKEDGKFSSLSVPSFCKESQMTAWTGDAENASSLKISNVDNMTVSHVNTSVNTGIQVDSLTMLSSVDSSCKENCYPRKAKSPEQIKVESTGSTDRQMDSFGVANDSFVDKSIVTTSCTSASSDGSHIGHWNTFSLQAALPSQKKIDSNHSGHNMVEGNLTSNILYMGTSFKPSAFINQYMHGDFAASAAAKLAVVSSEETREVIKAANGRFVSSDISLQAKAFAAVASRFFWPSSEKKLVEVPRERCGWCHSCKVPSNSKRGCMLNAAALAATKGAMKILSTLPAVTSEGSLPSISTYILYLGEILCGLTVGPFVKASYRVQWRKRVEDASNCKAIAGLLLELEENIRIIAFLGDWTKAVDFSLVDTPMITNAAPTVRITQRRGPGGKRHKKQSGASDLRANDRDDKSFVWWRGGKISKLVFQQAILPRLVVKRAARQGGSRKISGVYYGGDDPHLSKRSRQMAWRAAVERSKNASQLALQVRYLDLHVRWSDLVRTEQNQQEGKGPETEASVFRNATIRDKKIEENKISYGVAFGSQKHLPSRVMKNIIEIEKCDDGKERYWFSEAHVPLYLIKEYEEKQEKVKKAALPPVQNSSDELSELQKKQLKDSRKDIFLYLTFKRDKSERCSCASCRHHVLIRDAVKCSSCTGYCHKDCTISSSVYRNADFGFLITCKRCINARALVGLGNGYATPTTPLPSQGRESHDGFTATKGTKVKFLVNGKPVTPENEHRTPTASSTLQGRESQNTLAGTRSARAKIHNQPPSIRTQDSSSEMKQDISTSNSAPKTRTKCSWGVIWKKKNTDSGTDFRQKHIVLPGSSVILDLVCNLCKNGHDCNLMYIHCESCNGWFHAEAVLVDESNLSNVVGFKCCRCRRIRSPRCPYDNSVEVEKPTSQRQLKVGNLGTDPFYGTIVEPKDSEPSTPMFSREELLTQDDDPLLFSLLKVEQIMEENSNSASDLEWNDSVQGPQKLQVRKHSKPQASAEGLFENGHYSMSVPFDGNNIMYPQEESSHVEGPQKLPVRRQSKPQATTEGMLESSHYSQPSLPVDWDVSNNGVEGNAPMDYELNFEDMEFEPQTYFSFGELLASDEGGQIEGFDSSVNVTGNTDNQSFANSLDGFYEQYASDISVEPFYGQTAAPQADPLFGQYQMIAPQGEPLYGQTTDPQTTISTKQCKMCAHFEPVPELTCKVCNIVIHSHCSPWVESQSSDGTWTCGKCKEWR